MAWVQGKANHSQYLRTVLSQVVAMRLPLEAVLPHLPATLEGVLLWAADSKNKFKLKVRRRASFSCFSC